jgi:hypothetical protein
MVDSCFANFQPPQQQGFLLVWAIVQSSLLRSLQITDKIHFLNPLLQDLSQLLLHLHHLPHQPLLHLPQVHQFLLHRRRQLELLSRKMNVDPWEVCINKMEIG